MPPHLSEEIVFIEAIGMQESGGHYGVVNANSGALGKYQVMPANLAPWLRECHLPVVSAHKYLHDPILQDQLAKCKLGGDYNRYGVRGAASVWYSGQPNWRATYGNPPVYQYVDDIVAWIHKISNGQITVPSPKEPTLAAPKENDWHGHINVTTKGLYIHRNRMHGYHAQLFQLMRHAEGH